MAPPSALLAIDELLNELAKLYQFRSLDDRMYAALTVSQSYCLRILYFQGPRSMGELASELDVRLSTMTGIVDQLEARGLVERVDHPDDRRSLRVTLSGEGRALYRAATAAQLMLGAPAEAWTEEDVCTAAERVTFAAADGTFVPMVDGGSIEEELRGGEVTRHVSRVARMPRVREWVNAKVRETAASRDVVVDGRDMGTVVFPDANLKVFLVADPWERARRRLIQRLGRHPAGECQPIRHGHPVGEITADLDDAGAGLDGGSCFSRVEESVHA